MLRSDLCDFGDASIVVKGTVTVDRVVDRDAFNRKLAIKNCALFTSCRSKINNTLIDNAESSDIVMLMYDLIKYIKNYSKTSGSL